MNINQINEAIFTVCRENGEQKIFYLTYNNMKILVYLFTIILAKLIKLLIKFLQKFCIRKKRNGKQKYKNISSYIYITTIGI